MDIFDLFAKISLDSSEYESGLTEASEKTSGFADTLQSIGSSISNVGDTLFSAITTPVKDGITSLAEYGDNIDKMSQKLGMSAEAYQEWDAILQHSGASVDSLQSGLKTLAGKYDDAIAAINETYVSLDELDAQFESGVLTLDEYNEKYYEIFDAAYADMDAFRRLGISMLDLENTGGDTEKIFSLVIERLQEMPEGAERTAIASDLLGRSATELAALLNTSAEETEAMRQRVHELGGVMSDEAVKDAAAFQDSLQDLQTGFDGIVRTVLSDFLPVLTNIMDAVTDIVAWFGDLDEGTKNLIVTIVGISAAVGPVLIVTGKVITAIASIASGIGGLIGIVGKAGSAISGLFSILAANPIALVIAAVAALVAGLIVLWNTNEDFRNTVGAIWEAITEVFQSAWDAIKGAWEKAGEFFGGIVDGIKGVFDGIGEFLGGLFMEAWEAVQNAWDVAVEFFTGIGEGIQSVFETATDFLGEVFNSAWDVISETWNGAVDFFGGIWDGISGAFDGTVDFLGGVFSDAWDAVSGAWDGTVDWFSNLVIDILDCFGTTPGEFLSIGSNLVQGLWDGISGAWGEFWGWFTGKVDGIVDGAKNLLGIHSPSTAFAKIGKFMMQGLEEGVDGESGSVDLQMDKVIDTMLAAFSGISRIFSDIGQNAMSALSGSLGQAIGSLQSKVSGLMSDIARAAKAALGIHSPSKVFADIGGNMALGLAEGWDDEYTDIKRQITSGLDFGTATVGLTYNSSYNTAQTGQNGLQAGFGGTGNTYVTINSPVAVDAVTAAREWKKTAQRMAMGYNV